MKKVLVLGAGMVAGPLVNYLLEHGYQLTVTSLILEDAVCLVDGNPHGKAMTLDLTDEKTLASLVSEHDLIISLVPYAFHPVVAQHCLDSNKNLVTASYVSPDMQALDDQAKKQDLVFLNEIGLDPGIDHMSAMRIIDDVKSRGGVIKHFTSCCGGLPAEDAVDNPFGYKFSWAPRGVLLASRNGASYWRDGHVVEVEPKDLFRDMRLMKVPGSGVFEAYPNRDSLAYREIYKLGSEIQTVFRGTLRYIGWCDIMYNIAAIGLLDLEPRNCKGLTYAEFMRDLLKAEPGEELRDAAARLMQIPADCLPANSLLWLGLFSDEPIGQDEISPLDVLGQIMLEKLVYKQGERDMVVLYHEFKAWFEKEQRYERITSTLIDYGVPNGDSSMARTVSLPAAIAARLILEGKISQRGVLRPVEPEIYNPVLDELAEMGIVCDDKSSDFTL